MKLIYFYQETWEREYIRKELPGFTVDFKEGCLQDYPDLRDNAVEGLVVFVKSRVTASDFERFPNMRFIATRSTGFDHIDLVEAVKRNVMVMNVPAYGANTIAEHTFALLLTLSRKIYDAYERVRRDGSFAQTGLRGFDLAGKTIGIVGTGTIGRHVVRIAKGFDMHVRACDVHEDKAFAKEYDFEYVSFDDILTHSDIITLHVPLDEHTHHLINTDNISKIKRGAYLINTARGPVVQTTALVQALDTGILAGAGLDVLEEEEATMAEHVGEEIALLAGHPSEEKLRTVLQNHYLIDHPRVFITPHIAFNTDEALMRILDVTIANIMSVQAGTPTNIVE